MTRWLILVVFCILIGSVRGQTPESDSVVKLSGIEISAERLEQFSPGQKVQKIDSLTLTLNQNLNLSEILSRNTTIQLKNYNYNGLSLISFRGTSANHTGIYWSGFQINPASTSQVDLALIPSILFNDISVVYGGSSSLLGSGNIGGSIHLNNNPEFAESLTGNISLANGSFGEYNANGVFKFSNNKWYSKTGVTFKTANNNFTYENLKGESVRQQNASFYNYGLTQDVYRNFSENTILGLSLWYQENNREIPATITSKPSDASQLDKSLRVAINFRKYFKRGQLNFKSALLDDYLHYKDPDSISSIAIDSKITSLKLLSELNYKYQVLEGFVLSMGANYSYEEGTSDNYANTVVQRNASVYTSWLQKLPVPGWNLNVNLRQDYYNDFKSPFLYAVSFEGKIWKWFSGKLNFSKNFRIPTFHDRYWEPGGNLHLKPEDSKNAEATLVVEAGKKLRAKFLFTGYSSKVNNWILWVPDGIIWSPQNVQKVWARGLEFDGGITFTWLKINTKINGGYTFARSTNEIKQGPNDDSYQKQLLYVPEHKFYFNTSFALQGFVLNYNQSYTGLRYTTLDNNEFLPAYVLGNITLRKDFKVSSHMLGLQFDINNIWNEDYQAVLYYPMPGRSYKITVNFLFNKVK
ncbi:MAG: TonB-dependent receptor plug domain-containing protein [Bacteroidales bacterium]|nr:TonB-dependent receptor plug domain-containing protein [Bacteroidales bacterium]